MTEKMIKGLSYFFFVVILLFIIFLCLKMFVWDGIYQERNIRKDFLAEFYGNEGDDEPVGKNFKDDIYNRPFTVLLMGVDTNDASNGRSDTMILAVVEPEKEHISLLSIPRDSKVPIYGRGEEKITHAYAYGLDTAIYTVEDYFKVPIDFYASIDFDGFVELVDTIGGLNVDVERKIAFPDRITHENFVLQPGVQHLTGIQTLNYARYRYGPDGDYGRMRRQTQVLKDMADQTVSIRNIPKLNKLLDVLGDNLRTDIDLTQLVKMMLNLHTLEGNDISTIEMKSQPAMINGTSYVVIDESERLKIQEELTTLLKGTNN